MKKLIIYIILISQTVFLSCSKWLDIQPESDIDRDVLFSTEEGFKEALLGVYTRGAKEDLYGKELTIGTPEVLVQNYRIKSFDYNKYLPSKNYKYDDADFMRRKDAVWIGLYNGIVNTNLILENIDQRQKLFTGNNYQLIKGEALALRGYLHFDALRLFAPAYSVNPEATAIPYVNTYTIKTTKLSKSKEVIDSIIRDLEQAKLLLASDPIINASYKIGYPTETDTLQNSELHNKSLFLQNRRHRLNFFAVCGTLARIYLYKGDKDKALLNAMLVINAKKFPWTNRTDFLEVDNDKKDRIMYKELIFAWYIPSMNNQYNTNYFAENSNGMYIETDDARSIYETAGAGAMDMRYSQWFSGTNAGEVTIQKYRRNPLGDTFIANKHYLVAPAIRLSEMYYIAAECTYGSDPDRALSFIDEVRTHREIGIKLQAANLAQFETELLKEYRKEMYAEGQLFYAYKRLNKSIVGLQGEIIPSSQTIFVWPLPDDEIIYGDR